MGEVERPVAIGDDARVEGNGEEGGGGGGDGGQLGQVDPCSFCIEIERGCCEADKIERKECVSVQRHHPLDQFFSRPLCQRAMAGW